MIGVVVDSRLTIKLCQTTLRQFVGRLITSCDKFDPTHGVCIVDGCSSDNDPGIRLQSAELLQLGTQRHHREPFQRLKSVQNAAARLITQTGRREHITPVL